MIFMRFGSVPADESSWIYEINCFSWVVNWMWKFLLLNLFLVFIAFSFYADLQKKSKSEPVWLNSYPCCLLCFSSHFPLQKSHLHVGVMVEFSRTLCKCLSCVPGSLVMSSRSVEFLQQSHEIIGRNLLVHIHNYRQFIFYPVSSFSCMLVHMNWIKSLR